ncbi:hypothetical protein BOX15_Mlig013496g1, partial [Macrostomum lignano]
ATPSSSSGSSASAAVSVNWLNCLASKRVIRSVCLALMAFMGLWLLHNWFRSSQSMLGPVTWTKYNADPVPVAMATTAAARPTRPTNTTASELADPASLASRLAKSNLPACPEDPPGLLGNKIPVKSDPSLAPTWAELQSTLSYVRHGGCQPEHCVARQRVAIIVPYRNRDPHLRLLMSSLHPVLRRQQLDYRIFVVEQAGTTRFNRGLLFNIGFVESAKIFPAYCYIFHDVDLLPENDHNMYRCGANPRHLGAEISSFGYKLPYGAYFGGACALTAEQYRKMNGFPNIYFGWGAEDDDFGFRVAWAGYKVARYPPGIARYKMIKHNRDAHNEADPKRIKYLEQSKKRWKEDGLNSMQYNVIGVQDRQLVYFISVEISEEAIRRRAHLT